MKISVITACYNSEATVGHTIESFLRQSHPDKEMLIVDGASRDDTVKIAESFGSDQIRITSEPDKSLFDAMNKGLARYSGDAVGVLNSDDTFHDAHVLERVAQSLSAADIVYGDMDFVLDHDTKQVVRIWRSGPYRARALRRGWMPPHPTLYVRRDVVDRVGHFDLRYTQTADYDFAMRALALNDFRVRYLPSVLVDFKVGGTSTVDWRASLRGNLQCLDARRRHLGAPPVDIAFFARYFERLFQIRGLNSGYWSRFLLGGAADGTP